MAGIKFFAPGNEVKTRMLTRVDMARSVFYQFFLLAAPTLLALLQEVKLDFTPPCRLNKVPICSNNVSVPPMARVFLFF